MIPELPPFWREEIWHPLSVHLPIITLFLASVGSIISSIQKLEDYKLFLSQFITVMLVMGVIGGWIAIYTGELAYNIEVRKICDPQVLQEHQWWAYCVLISYTLALVIKFSSNWLTWKNSRFLKIMEMFILVIAMLCLFYMGHLGASLVYQQGAGVYRVSEDCREFN